MEQLHRDAGDYNDNNNSMKKWTLVRLLAIIAAACALAVVYLMTL
jgi:hypothetical protein